MLIKKIIYTVTISILFFNCSSGGDDTINQPNPQPDPDPLHMGTVTYEAHIKSIMTNHCNQCHGSPTTNGAPMSLTTYVQVKNFVDPIITRVNSSANPMPPAPQAPLSVSERNLIQRWKDDGLLEN